MEEDNKTLLRKCNKLDNEIKTIVEKMNHNEKTESGSKVSNVKSQNENNIKEIKKLNQRINELSQENKTLITEIEEIKRERQEKIDILNQNLMCK